MPLYDLIPVESYQDLPDDAGQKLLVLIKVADDNFVTRSSTTRDRELDVLRNVYIGQVNAITEELGFGPLPLPTPGTISELEWVAFSVAVKGVISKIHLRSASTSRQYSVLLGRITKARILQEIERLRQFVDASDLPEKKKRAIYDRLDELTEELNKKRLSFARLAAIAASIAGTIGGSAVALANTPAALENVARILQYVGEEKAVEDEERLALPPPAKALPAPEKRDVDEAAREGSSSQDSAEKE